MVLNRATKTTTDSHMDHICSHISSGSVIVFNDTRVLNARLYGQAETGSRVEILLVKRLSELRWWALTSRGKKQRVGRSYALPDGVIGTIVTDDGQFKEIEVSKAIDDGWLEKHGNVPLPPYIHRPNETGDADRYQTVYSRETGSIAAPTAGLHFTDRIIGSLAKHGVDHVFLTLHVGVGTFLPMRSINVEDHVMHEEEYEITVATANRINRALRQNSAVIAVGTTTVRTLESAWQNGGIKPGRRRTELFIKPGHQFKTIQGFFTNFHTPESTLLVMVSAFAGIDFLKTAYREAIGREYRFFSYGDAMLVL